MVEVVIALYRHSEAATALRKCAEFSCGESCELLQPHLDGAAAPLAATDDQNGIVTSDGADDLAPPGAVERQAQRGSRRRLQHEQRADALGGNEHRGQQLLQVWADTRRAFRRRRIVRAPVRRRDLRET